MSDRTAALVVLGVAFALALPGFLLRADPTSDGLFYEARAAQLDGMSQADAFRAVFEGPRGHEVAAIEGSDRITDARWYEYTAPFYERRWLVPALAVLTANLTGWSIAEAMQRVSMFGYIILGPLLFLLLRRRFSTWPSIAGALGCLLLPPLYRWSFGPLVDSWGLALMTLGMLALILAADRGLRWLPLWVLTVAAYRSRGTPRSSWSSAPSGSSSHSAATRKRAGATSYSQRPAPWRPCPLPCSGAPA